MPAPKLAFLLLFTVSGLLFCQGGPHGPRNPRSDVHVSIINPNYTDVTNYPYTVSVAWNGDLMGGGVLVDTRWVLTAAFNCDGIMPSHLKVRVGSNSATSGGKIYKVTTIVQHPSYSGNWTFDLTLLKLGSKVNTTYGTPVALATSAFQGQGSGVITGYGNTTETESWLNDSSEMETATIGMYDYATCNQKWYKGSDDGLRAGQLCGYTSGVGPCTLDFGDPLVMCEQSCTLVGMFAGSYGCADDHFPGVYTDIGYFNDWISQNVKK